MIVGGSIVTVAGSDAKVSLTYVAVDKFRHCSLKQNSCKY